MKKSVMLTLAALAALMAASCQKEDTGRILTATFEQYEHNSKAYINDEYYACWENGDAVSINGNQYLINIENTTATIAAPTSGDLMAFYPADGVTGMSSTGGTVKLPHIQTYAENTDGKQIIDNPMAAYCPEGSNELRFRNLCALLKVTIQVDAPTSVKAIQVKGIDNQMLWGEAQLMLNNQNQPMLTSFTNGSNSVMLNFTSAVTINGSKSFYIVVPAKSDFENLTIAVLTTDGTNYANNSKTSLIEQALSRNQIGAISYTLNGDEDATFAPDWMIRYTASSAITTSITGVIFGSTCKSRAFNNGNGNGYLLFDGPVTTIPAGISSGSNLGSKYFKSCSSITLPASITTIETSAFYGCNRLTSITLPASLTSIGAYAFRDCSSLTSISLPQGVTSIGTYAFYGCSSLTSISLPQGVTSIGNYTFQFCSSLTSISLPQGVTSIGNYTFQSCSSLTSISLPASLTSIGNRAFSGCSSLTSINLPANLTSIGTNVFSSCSSLTNISLPANLTSIGNDAFYGCSSLTSISLPANLTTIGSSAFRGCSSLTSISLPQGVTSIGNYTFKECSKLTSISLPQGMTSIGSYAFEDCISLTSINLPASLTSIGFYAFSSCISLTSINLPANLTSIGTSAFLDCSSLTSINLPANLTSIGASVFQNCSSLTSINLPASLTSIGSNAFYNCSNLTSINLPASLTSIGIVAFQNCSSLVRVDCHRTTPPTIQTNTFSTIPTDIAVLHVPSGHGSDYSGWSGYFQGGIVEDL